MQTTVTLLLSVIVVTVASELSCSGHFPIKESVENVRRLVAKYAVSVVRKDENGVEWINNLFITDKEYEIDDTRYYLNDNRLSPEMTFYFEDSLLLDAVPIFVVEEKQLKNWRPDHPDKTYALTKISHECSVGQRACGLKCCYSESDKIQQGFLELAREGNLQNNSTFIYNDIIYSFELSNLTSVCAYDLSYYDILFRRARIRDESLSTIHFSCPKDHTCCGLSCMPLPLNALLRKTRNADDSSSHPERRKNVLLLCGSAMAFTVFLVTTVINYRNAGTNAEGSRSNQKLILNLCKRQDLDSQSTISIHLDADARTLLDHVSNV
ncbi:unnamed protein product [Cylicocyclus nassatus]|uniref:CX domain-containing protein n=1 Tax=Cylicocyclus nassatus TaxID=53992 RepID=A0AA36MCC5_CYLNA|nr:unnamed protein product [Cylicocyclus nassatus]